MRQDTTSVLAGLASFATWQNWQHFSVVFGDDSCYIAVDQEKGDCWRRMRPRVRRLHT